MRDMLNHAEEAIEILGSDSEEDLREDRVRSLALAHLVEIVGEAANRVPRETQLKHPAIPWRDVIGMRHRLAHGYDVIDVGQLCLTIQEDLPPLVAALTIALQSP